MLRYRFLRRRVAASSPVRWGAAVAGMGTGAAWCLTWRACLVLGTDARLSRQYGGHGRTAYVRQWGACELTIRRFQVLGSTAVLVSNSNSAFARFSSVRWPLMCMISELILAQLKKTQRNLMLALAATCAIFVLLSHRNRLLDHDALRGICMQKLDTLNNVLYFCCHVTSQA